MVNYNYLLLISIFTAIVMLVSFKVIKTPIYRTGLGLLLISIFVYCGIGTSFYDVNPIYILYYIVFLIVSVMAFILCIKVSIKKQKKSIVFDSFFSKNIKILGVCTWLLFILTLINLMIPQMRITKLFSFDLFDIIDIFERHEALREDPLTYIINLIKLNLLPFFCMYLYRLKKDNKKLVAVILFLTWIYMEFTILGYISRNQMLMYLMFVFAIYFEKNGKIGIKIWVFLAIAFILSIPILLAFEFLRMGVSAPDIGFLKAFELLFMKECDYPKYYSTLSQFDSNGMAVNYFIWLFTLPIPKKLLFIDTIQINDIFTFFITGVQRFEHGFSILLPSVLGEGIMLYGNRFFWIHGIVIGVISGLLMKFINRYKYLQFWNYYFMVQLFTIGRGGSQGVFAIVNSMMFLFVWIFVLKFVRGKKYSMQQGVFNA